MAADYAGQLSDQQVQDREMAMVFAAGFGYEPTRREFDWVVGVARILGRQPTSEELRASTRGKDRHTHRIPSGPDDEAIAQHHVTDMGRLPTCADWKEADLRAATGGHDYYVSKARVIRTADNPSSRQIENSLELQKIWGPSIFSLLDAGKADGFHKDLTDEEVASGEWSFLDPVWVHLTKDNGDLKSRLTPHGGQEPEGTFAEHSLTSSCPGMEAIKFALAVAAYHNLRIVVSDVKDAHPRHNLVDDPACVNKRKIAVWLTPFYARSDRPRALGFLSITNGLKDAGNIFCKISTRTLLSAGYKRTSGDAELFHQEQGHQGLSLVVKQVDDIANMFSRDAEGGCELDDDHDPPRQRPACGRGRVLRLAHPPVRLWGRTDRTGAQPAPADRAVRKACCGAGGRTERQRRRTRRQGSVEPRAARLERGRFGGAGRTGAPRAVCAVDGRVAVDDPHVDA